MFVKLGSVGDQVSQLQQTLIEAGLDVGVDASDHIFGKDTRAAVLRFQSEHFGQDGKPLKIDGIVGDNTWWALLHPTAGPAPGADDLPLQPVGGEIAAAAMKAALGELAANVVESPVGSNRSSRIDVYTGYTGRPATETGPPWCAFFVSWCFAQNPQGSPFGRIGGALNIAHWGERNNCAIARGALPPLAGDIFVIDRDGIHGHTGIVRAVVNDEIATVEGNSSNAVRTTRRPISSIETFVRIRP
jgi:hypothetical protein